MALLMTTLRHTLVIRYQRRSLDAPYAGSPDCDAGIVIVQLAEDRRRAEADGICRRRRESCRARRARRFCAVVITRHSVRGRWHLSAVSFDEMKAPARRRRAMPMVI